MKSIFFFLSALFFIGSGCSQNDNSDKGSQSQSTKTEGVYRTVDARAFEEAVESGEFQILDVRTSEECEGGMIDGAVKCDILTDEFETKVKSLDKKTPVLVYCASGVRSLKAMKRLEELGFDKVLDLEGGYANWRAAQR